MIITSYDISQDVILTEPALLILASLADGEKHGYGMILDIEAFAGVRLGPGTLYGAIVRLEERGFICAAEAEDRRKPYCITGAGRAELSARMGALNPMVKAMMDRAGMGRAGLA